MEQSNEYKKGFIPYALAAFLIGIVGGFSTVLGPSFVQDIGIAYNNTTWTALAQAMSTAACAPILGKVGDVIGRKRTLLLGIAVFIQQLDLAAIAALIAVLGTGIDQLVIITDEVMHEGKVPSKVIYTKRLKRALLIIMTSAATVIIAMFPLIIMDLSTLKGFAIINILGILIGVLITRPAYGRIVMEILSKK